LIELLGVGVPDVTGGWLLHRVCTRLTATHVTAIVATRPLERRALLDCIAGRRVPAEGRVWVGGVPVAADTTARIGALVADVRPGDRVGEQRSLRWNVVVDLGGPSRTLRTLARLPSRARRRAADDALATVGLGARARDPARSLDAAGRARLLVARALAAGPEVVIVREVDLTLKSDEVADLLALLRRVAAERRVAVLVSLAGPAAAGLALADRVLGIAEGVLVFDGPPARLATASALRRHGVLVGGG
jgi:ABC-type cobalamin/Fe3+-siderophores transport system ATPase subunit